MPIPTGTSIVGVGAPVKCPASVAYWEKKADDAIRVSILLTGFQTDSVQVTDAQQNIIGNKSAVLPDGGTTWTVALTEPVAKIAQVSLAAAVAGQNHYVCNVQRP